VKTRAPTEEQAHADHVMAAYLEQDEEGNPRIMQDALGQTNGAGSGLVHCPACDRGPLPVFEGLCLACWAARARIWENVRPRG
jgi:hypothetical protein